MKEVVFFLLGAAVGGVVALMFAPASGAEFRDQIRTAAEKEASQLQSDWQRGLEKTNEKLDKLQADLKQALKQQENETEVEI